MLRREIFQGIENGWVTYLFALITFAALAYFGGMRINRWTKARKDKVQLNWRGQGLQFFKSVLSQRLLNDQKTVGIAHVCVFYGFTVLFAGTVLLMFDNHLRLRFLEGNVYIIYKFVLNFFGLVALAGMTALIVRRLLFQSPARQKLTEFLPLILPLLALVTGFLTEGSRIAGAPADNPGWQFWAFPVYPAVAFCQEAGLTDVKAAHGFFWWLHMILSMATIVACGQTRLSHIIAVPLNFFYQIPQQPGQLTEPDLTEKQFGAGKMGDFTKKQLISITACVDAGRCETHCPAFRSNKPLSPRLLMDKLRRADDCAELLAGDSIDREAIWACTTCGACRDVCPAMANPAEKIIELRRHEVMALGSLPRQLQNPMISLQKRGHPWSGTRFSRLDWTNGLDVPLAAEKKNFDVLFWVGCAGALLERNIKTSQAMAKLLRRCRIDFAILGQEENCTCHLTRRTGDEHMYQIMKKKNIAKLKQYSFHTIVTACPHCYHTLKNEYQLPRLGLSVVSHAEFFSEQIKKKTLGINPAGLTEKVTYHDPCYYGRINAIFNPPREICGFLGAKLCETAAARENSFCCGGGGGGFWLDEANGQRMNEARVKQLLDKNNNIELITTACPFCVQMLESGLNSLGYAANIKVRDIAELLERQLEQ